MGAGASAQPLVPPPTEPKETADKNDDSLTSVHDARLAALLRGAGTPKLTYSDSAFEALLARNLPSPLEWPPASETRRRRKTLDRLQELFGKASLSSRQAAQTVAQLMPDDDERDAVAEFLMARVDASARPAYVTALSRCEPPLAADLLERLGARATREVQDAAIEAVSRGPAPQKQATRPVATTPTKKSAPPRHPNKPSAFSWLFRDRDPAPPRPGLKWVYGKGWIPDNIGKHGAPPSPLEHIIDADVADRRSQA